MRTKMQRMMVFCAGLLLMLNGAATAATNTWTGGGADSLWTTSGNWDMPPVAGNLVHVDATGNNPLINMDVADGYDSVYFGVNSSAEVVLTMQSGGHLRADSGGAIAIGSSAGTTARVEMSGGNLSGRQVRVGSSGTGTINMSGGDITVSDWVGVGANAGSAGTLNVSGGAISAYNVTAGNHGAGTIDISGGTVTANNWIGVARYSDASGSSITLRNSGSLQSHHLSLGLDGTGTFDMQGGTFTLTGTDGRLRMGEGPGAGTWNLSGGTATVGNQVHLGYSASSVGANTLRVTGGNLTAKQIVSGYYATGILEVSGAGKVVVTDWIGVGDKSGSSGTFNMDGGEVDTYKLSVGLASTGVFTMTDGLLNLTTTAGTDARIRLGEGSGTGVWNMEGGTVYAPKDIVVGYSTSTGTDLLNMSGGDVYAGSLIVGSDGDGMVTLSGGNLYVDYAGSVSVESGLLFDTGVGDGLLDITGNGTLNWLGGDFTAEVNAFVLSGDIVAYSGEGTVNVAYDSGSNTTIITATVPPSFWTGDGANNLWTTSENWSTVPDTGDDAIIDITANNPLVNMDVAAVYDNIYIGESNPDGVVLTVQSGGHLRQANVAIFVAHQFGSTGTLDMSGGAIDGRDLVVGKSGAGVVNQTGGAVDVTRLILAENLGSSGLYSISGGSFTVDGSVYGNAGTTVFEVLGSGATSIEAGSVDLSEDTFRVKLDDNGSTLVRAVGGGINLTNATIEVDILTGFSGTLGDTYDIMWTTNGFLTDGMAFVDNSGAGFEWQIVPKDGGEALQLLIQGGASFKIIAIPDTQRLIQYNPSYVSQQTTWIVNNLAAENIKFVTHLGDVVDDDDNTQWNAAVTALDILDGEIPYSVCLGNHDFDGKLSNQPPIRKDEGTAQFTSRFGASRYAGYSWYKGSNRRGLNHYQIFTAAGRDWLHLNLEYQPDDESLLWGQRVLDAHPDLPVIFSTHSYLRDSGDLGFSDTDVGGLIANGGNNIWNKFVRHNDQIFMVLNGHYFSGADGVAKLTSQNEFGHDVFQMCINYQGVDTDASIRLLEFDSANDAINATTYDPHANSYKTGSDHQFSLSIDFDARLNSFSPREVLDTVQAGNVLVVENNTDNDATSVTVSIPAGRSTADFSVSAVDHNNGDYFIQAGSIREDDALNGVMLASVAENGRANLGISYPKAYHIASIASGGSGYSWVATAETARQVIDGSTTNQYWGGAERDVNVAVAYFPFSQGWTGGRLTSIDDGSPTWAFVGSENIELDINLTQVPQGTLSGSDTNLLHKATIAAPLWGNPEVDRAIWNLTLSGVDSQSDGILLVCGGKNEDNYAATSPYSDGSGWQISLHDSSGTGWTESDPWNFVYIPYSTEHIFAGRGNVGGTITSGTGGFSLTANGTGSVRLDITGYTPTDGTLIVSTENDWYNADDFITYEPEADHWIIENRDLPEANLASSSTPQFAFLFIPFDNAPARPGPEAGFDYSVEWSGNDGLWLDEANWLGSEAFDRWGVPGWVVGNPINTAGSTYPDWNAAHAYINSGTARITPASGPDGRVGQLYAGSAALSATLEISSDLTVKGHTHLGVGSTAGSVAVINQTAGNVALGSSGGSRVYMGRGAGESIYNLSGGTLATVGDWDQFGYSDTATFRFNQTGGTYTDTGASELVLVNTAGNTAVVTVEGGIFKANATSRTRVASHGTATINIGGTGAMESSSTSFELGYYSDATGILNLSNGTFTVTGTYLYVGTSGSGEFKQSGGDADVTRLIMAKNVGSTGIYSISGGSLNAHNYIIGGADGNGIFEVVGSGATSIETDTIYFYEDTFRVKLDENGSTLVRAVGGTYNGGIDLRKCTLEVDTLFGFDGIVGDVYDIMWTAGGLQTTDMVFSNLSATDFWWRVANTNGGDMLQVIVGSTANNLPTFTTDPINLGDAMENSAYSDTLAGTATDTDLDSLTYSKVFGPAWLNVATNGALSGTPALSDGGTNSWSVQVSDGNGGTDQATLNIVVQTILPKDDMALSESTTYGTVSGTLANSQGNDDLYEEITEAVDGTPTSLLEHEWIFNVYGAELVSFYVEAHHTVNAEGDDFVFAYSTNGTVWTDMVTITKTANDDTVQWYALPSGLNGTVYIRVMDTDRSASNTALDTVYVDALFIYSEESTVAPAVATTPVPANGTVDIPLNQDLSWTAGVMTTGHDVYFGTSATPAFQGTQIGTTFDPGALANSTLYYWAVDEANNTGTTAGPTWSFTTVAAPNTQPAFTADPVVEANATENNAYSSSLADNATDADLDTLSFSKVFGPTWLSIASNGALSGTPASGDVGLNSFSVQVSDGNGGTDTATLQITVDATSPSWIQLTFDNFESGMGNWIDGGGDVALSGSYAIGNQCLDIQDNSGDASSTWLASSLDLSSYSELKIEFTYMPISMDKGVEDFWVQFSDDGGSGWTTIKAYVVDADFVNGTREYPVVIIDDTGYNFTSNVKIKIRCDASSNVDDIYLDDITISAQ